MGGASCYLSYLEEGLHTCKVANRLIVSQKDPRTIPKTRDDAEAALHDVALDADLGHSAEGHDWVADYFVDEDRD
ncbi:MAG: hypothetical protein H6Q67_520 [Firmicutes bacterium]|nr:hypothetical protein [Bacillota bacterium]